MNKLIPWLLKFDGYPPGVVVALLLHGILLYIFLPKEFEPSEQVAIQPMSFVVASAVKESPQRLRRLNQLENQRRNDEAARDRRREQDRQREREAAAEVQRQAEITRQREATERQRIADEQERERERAEEERQRVARDQENERRRQQEVADQQAAAEAARITAANNAAQQQQMSVENQVVAQYMAIIQNLVSNAWSRPPNARNGMLAIVRLRLTPTGEIISSEIVQSNGTPEFDRSVLAAVDRVGRFPELQDMPSAIFERKFRAGIDLEFSPEDLLR